MPIKFPVAQELANYFAPWTRIRQNDQAVGHQLLNVASHPITEMQHEVIRAGANNFLDTFNLDELDILYKTVLPVSFSFDVESETEAGKIYEPPAVRGYHDSAWHDLELVKDNSLQSLFKETIPSRVTKDRDILHSGVELHLLADGLTSTDFPYATELTHHITEGGHVFFEADGGSNYLAADVDGVYRARVLVTGISRKGIEETEVIVFPWAMRQRSLKQWRTITRLEVYDWPTDATLTVRSANFLQEDHIDFWNERHSVNDLKIDTFYKLDVRDNLITSLEMREYFTDEWQALVSAVEPEKQTVYSSDLLDTGGQNIIAIDMAIQPFTNRVWVLDSTGNLHLYDSREQHYEDIGLLKTRTDGPHVFIEATQPTYKLGEDIEFIPVHLRVEKEINKYRVWVQEPDGSKYGLLDNVPVAFSSDFWISMLDQTVSRSVGKLCRYTTSRYGEYLLGIDVQFIDGEMQYDRLLVRIPFSTPLSTINVAGLVGEESVTGIAFDSDQRLWLLSESKYHRLALHEDYMLIDYHGKMVFTKEEYEQVEVTVDAGTTLYTPVAHSIFNELDSIGMLLGLPRLPNEHNAPYKHRLLDVMVHKSSSTYLGLLFGITRELGQSIQRCLSLTVNSTDGVWDNPEPVITFEFGICTIYDDYSNNSIVATIDCHDPLQDTFTIGGLVAAINATGVFTATILDCHADVRSSVLYNQSSVQTVNQELLRSHSTHVALDHTHVVSDSLAVFSNQLTRRVPTVGNLELPGDYALVPESGNLYTNRTPGHTDTAYYKYMQETFMLYWSPVVLRSLQDPNIHKHMFEQITDDEDNIVNGLPTEFGADIINELMSVFPAGWGK